MMKKLLSIVAILFLMVSCGQKAPSSMAKFKIFSGNLTTGTDQFTGGLLIMGKSQDNAQTFIIPYAAGLELELKKGAWQFAIIGWMGTKPMEGSQQCDHQIVEINSDNFIVNFSMAPARCLTSRTTDGKYFTDPRFFDFNAAPNYGFKKVTLKLCWSSTPSISFGNCSGYSSYPRGSFQVEIPVNLDGIPMAGVVPGFKTACQILPSAALGTNPSLATNIAPPYGGEFGFIGTNLKVYQSNDCTGVSKDYEFKHGLAETTNYQTTSGEYRNAKLSPFTHPFVTDLDKFQLAGSPIILSGTLTSLATNADYNKLFKCSSYVTGTPCNGTFQGYVYYVTGGSWASIDTSLIDYPAFINGKLNISGDDSVMLFVTY